MTDRSNESYFSSPKTETCLKFIILEVSYPLFKDIIIIQNAHSTTYLDCLNSIVSGH